MFVELFDETTISNYVFFRKNKKDILKEHNSFLRFKLSTKSI